MALLFFLRGLELAAVYDFEFGRIAHGSSFPIRLNDFQ
jgi:hypothetical protein